VDVRRNTRLNGIKKKSENDEERYKKLKKQIRQKIRLAKEDWMKG